jgi:hypothetical protein
LWCVGDAIISSLKPHPYINGSLFLPTVGRRRRSHYQQQQQVQQQQQQDTKEEKEDYT